MYRKSSVGTSASRSSIAGGGPLRTRNTPDPQQRLTLLGGSTGGSRKSSLTGGKKPYRGPPRLSMRYGGGSQDIIFKDPRPLNDKAFKDESIKALIDFLSDRGYGYPLNAKLLHGPTTKDFVRIFEFIMQSLIANYKCEAKIEIEIPQQFKKLAYRVNLSKSSMATVGSPHTWPSLLGALRWLISIAKYVEAGIPDAAMFLCEEFAETNEEKLFFISTENAYKYWMSGEDDLSRYDEELQQILNFGISDNASLANESAELQQQLSALEHTPNELQSLRDLKLSSQSDGENLAKWEGELNKRNMSLKHSHAALDVEAAALRADLDVLQADIDTKQQVLSTQEFSSFDVERIKRERQELQRQKEVQEREMSDLQQCMWDYELQIGKGREALDKKCGEFNKMATVQGLMPATAPNACGLEYEMKAMLSEAESNKFVSTIKPALNQVSSQCATKVQETEHKLYTAQGTREQLDDIKSERNETVAQLKFKLQQLESEHECLRTTEQCELQQLQTEAQEMQEQRVQLEHNIPRHQQLSRTVDKTKERLEKQKEHMNCEANKAREFLLVACDRILQHTLNNKKNIKTCMDVIIKENNSSGSTSKAD